MKKGKAIVFVLTQSYKFALAAMIVNLQATNRQHYDDIVIYHSGLDAQDCEDLRLLENRLVFIEYTQQDWQQEHGYAEIQSKQLQNFINRFSHLSLSKYKVMEQLAYYQHILFLDLDMLIQGDLGELFAIKGMAWRSEAMFVRKFGTFEHKPQISGLAEVPAHHPAPNGGLFYADDSINWAACVADAREFIRVFAGSFGSVVDELSFSWAAYKNRVVITELDHTVYNVLPKVAQYQSKIIHFMGNKKVWNNEVMQSFFGEWVRYYKQANQTADFTSEKFIDFGIHGQMLRRQLNQIHWLEFFRQHHAIFPDGWQPNFDWSSEQIVYQYRSGISLEISLNHQVDEYKIGLRIEPKEVAHDKLVFTELENMVARQPDLLVMVQGVWGVMIQAKRVHKDKLEKILPYFINICHPVLSLVGK